MARHGGGRGVRFLTFTLTLTLTLPLPLPLLLTHQGALRLRERATDRLGPRGQGTG